MRTQYRYLLKKNVNVVVMYGVVNDLAVIGVPPWSQVCLHYLSIGGGHTSRAEQGLRPSGGKGRGLPLNVHRNCIADRGVQPMDGAVGGQITEAGSHVRDPAREIRQSVWV